MAEIYLPIDFSDVRDAIPLGESIIYSTLCKAYYNDAGSLKIWMTQVLLTEKGVAFSMPGESGIWELKYVDWTRVWFVLKKGLRVYIVKGYPYSNMDFASTIVDLSLKMSPNESKQEFKERSKRFPRKFMPFLIEKKKNFLNSPQSSFLYSKQRYMLEKSVMKMERYYLKKFK